MSSKLTLAYVKSTMEQRLGISRRSVELKDADYEQAMEQSLDLWNEYRSRVECHRATGVTTTENNPYTVTLTEDCLGIRACYFLVPYYDVASGLTIFELAEKLAITRLGIKDIALTRSTWESYKRVRGVDPSWQFIVEGSTRKLVVFAPAGPYDMGYEPIYAYTAATQIEIDRDATFLRLIEGYTRLILAEIRGKFGGQVMAPGGGQFNLNADRQIQKGEELIAAVRETLSMSRPSRPVPFYV